MKHIGFTGTRHGMTDAQRKEVDRVLTEMIDESPTAIHHGDCVGADDQFNDIAGSFGFDVHVGHPPVDSRFRANCLGIDEWRDPKSYIHRNRDIVNESDFMIATPAEGNEQQRGGTWSTIRYARKAGKPLAIVWPDGRVTYERWPHAQ